MKKQRLIYSLIISVVILSLFLVSTFPVSADAYYEKTITYKGEELANFLNRFYELDFYASSDPDGPFEKIDDQFIGANNFQLVLSHCGDNAYLVFNFPSITGQPSIIKNKYIMLRFRSYIGGALFPSLVGKVQVNFNHFSTTVYKRYVASNGDGAVSLPGGLGYFDSFSCVLHTTQYESDYFKEFSSNPVTVSSSGTVGGLQTFDFPYINQSIVNGRSLIIEEQPFRTNDASSSDFGKYIPSASVVCNVNYDPYEEYGIEYDGVTDFEIRFDSHNAYSSGMIMFAITPITISVVSTEFEAYLDFLREMTPQQYEEWKASLDRAEASQDFLESGSSTLNGYTDFVDSNQDRPNIDMNYLLNLENIGSLSSGISSFASGSAPLFQDSAFFNIFPIIAAPPLIISYLLFGKKG